MMMMMIAQSNNIITEEKWGGLWPLSPPQNDAYGGAYFNMYKLYNDADAITLELMDIVARI